MFVWKDASGGKVPETAVQGGTDDQGDVLYVGRAEHEGALTPGKVKPCHGVCYVSWNGAEHAKPKYQVLCRSYERWVAAANGKIPPNAFQAGKTEQGEPLYIGRVHHKNTVTIGKVQESHKVCYIPYNGEELHFSEYEVLVGL